MYKDLFSYYSKRGVVMLRGDSNFDTPFFKTQLESVRIPTDNLRKRIPASQ